MVQTDWEMKFFDVLLMSLGRERERETDRYGKKEKIKQIKANADVPTVFSFNEFLIKVKFKPLLHLDLL